VLMAGERRRGLAPAGGKAVPYEAEQETQRTTFPERAGRERGPTRSTASLDPRPGPVINTAQTTRSTGVAACSATPRLQYSALQRTDLSELKGPRRLPPDHPVRTACRLHHPSHADAPPECRRTGQPPPRLILLLPNGAVLAAGFLARGADNSKSCRPIAVSAPDLFDAPSRPRHRRHRRSVDTAGSTQLAWLSGRVRQVPRARDAGQRRQLGGQRVCRPVVSVGDEPLCIRCGWRSEAT
jgi:hypothetical protein